MRWKGGAEEAAEEAAESLPGMKDCTFLILG